MFEKSDGDCNCLGGFRGACLGGRENIALSLSGKLWSDMISTSLEEAFQGVI